MRLDVCFVGIGSIAKRHIWNLQKVCVSKGIELHIDAIRRKPSEEQEKKELGIENVYTSIHVLDKVYDVIFVMNPTEFHLETVKSTLQYGKHFFIEKPITSLEKIGLIDDIAWKEDSVYYVACPLRYNAVIQYIKNNVNREDVISIRSISSSYLPDWRPGVDYRTVYSAHKELGGGVAIDLIHEWDYLSFLFGNPEKIHSFVGKKSSLEINSEDYAIYIAEYSDMTVELHLDYYGRKTIREIMIFTKEDTIVGDIANNQLKYLKSGKVIDFQEERNDYQIRELEHFISLIDGERANDSSVQHARSVLRLTQGWCDE